MCVDTLHKGENDDDDDDDYDDDDDNNNNNNNEVRFLRIDHIVTGSVVTNYTSNSLIRNYVPKY
jgi:hypothetical protein